jgi:hypothetical protein
MVPSSPLTWYFDLMIVTSSSNSFSSPIYIFISFESDDSSIFLINDSSSNLLTNFLISLASWYSGWLNILDLPDIWTFAEFLTKSLNAS